MKSIKQWFFRWKLKRVVAALAMRTSVDAKDRDGVYAYAKMLEATEIMTRGLKKGDDVTMSCTREELDQFIRYMTTLHDSRLSLLIRARIGLATLTASSEKVLGETPENVMQTEAAQTMKGRKSTIVDPRGKKMEINL
jgi:hypothetical protein